MAGAAAVGVTWDSSQWAITDYKRLFANAVATGEALLEQLFDAFVVDIETTLYTKPSGHKAWIQAMMFKFQYSATNPQQATLDTTTFDYGYSVVNETLRIIKWCSVNNGALGAVIIKTAKDDGTGEPTNLTVGEIAAAQSYANDITVAGLNWSVVSYDADRLYLQAEITYKGVYSAVIYDNVVAALSAYRNSIPFDGKMNLDDLLAAIKGATGVTGVVFNNVYLRKSTDAFGAGTLMVVSNAWVQLSSQIYAGYFIFEDTVGETLADSLTFTAE